MPDKDREYNENDKKRMTNLRFFFVLIVAAINIAIIIFIVKLVFSRLGDFESFLK